MSNDAAGPICILRSPPISGRFSFNNVAPGNYRIFAWEEIPTGAYQDPDYIRRFESRGKPVVVEQSGSTEIEVSLIPAN